MTIPCRPRTLLSHAQPRATTDLQWQASSLPVNTLRCLHRGRTNIFWWNRNLWPVPASAIRNVSQKAMKFLSCCYLLIGQKVLWLRGCRVRWYLVISVLYFTPLLPCKQINKATNQMSPRHKLNPVRPQARIRHTNTSGEFQTHKRQMDAFIHEMHATSSSQQQVKQFYVAIYYRIRTSVGLFSHEAIMSKAVRVGREIYENASWSMEKKQLLCTVYG